MMKDIAVDIAKSREETQKHLQKAYGGSPERIEKLAKLHKMSVEDYIEKKIKLK